jgi:hypothetical protein
MGQAPLRTVRNQQTDLGTSCIGIAQVEKQDGRNLAVSVVDVFDSFVLSVQRRLGLGDLADERRQPFRELKEGNVGLHVPGASHIDASCASLSDTLHPAADFRIGCSGSKVFDSSLKSIAQAALGLVMQVAFWRHVDVYGLRLVIVGELAGSETSEEAKQIVELTRPVESDRICFEWKLSRSLEVFDEFVGGQAVEGNLGHG